LDLLRDRRARRRRFRSGLVLPGFPHQPPLTAATGPGCCI
jgi:hypothetical protein